MAFSLQHSIMPMSDLRADPDKIKKQLKLSPVLITNKGRPDFGVCDLETLEIATQVKQVRDLLRERSRTLDSAHPMGDVFARLLKKLDD